MCFAPQRRSIFLLFFDIRTSKSGPGMSIFLTFSRANALRATAACHFSGSQLPKCLRPWSFLYIFHLQMCFAPQRRAVFADRNLQNVLGTVSSFNIFTCKCASRHSAVPFLQIATCKMCLGPSVFFNIFTYKCALRHSAVPFLQMATSKMLPTKRCFVHFDLEMCFSLQRRTEAGHSVARWTRVTSEVWACVKYVPKQFIP